MIWPQCGLLNNCLGNGKPQGVNLQLYWPSYTFSLGIHLFYGGGGINVLLY